MYKEFETKTSYNYLRNVIKNLNEPICILGGWAVFFHVNKNFEKSQGRPYLGSRDIDLGFNISGNLKQSALSKTILILTEKLNFKPLSFRLMKEIHIETEEEIKDGQIVPAHFIFPMYVDLIVDSIPKDFKKLLIPKQELLLAMKATSLPNRDKEHKKIKDICDMFALAWYSDINFDEVNLTKYVSKKILKKCLKSITNKDFERASVWISHEKEELKRVIGIICERE